MSSGRRLDSFACIRIELAGTMLGPAVPLDVWGFPSHSASTGILIDLSSSTVTVVFFSLRGKTLRCV